MKNAGLFVILIFRRKGFGKSACFLLAGLSNEIDYYSMKQYTMDMFPTTGRVDMFPSTGKRL